MVNMYCLLRGVRLKDSTRSGPVALMLMLPLATHWAVAIGPRHPHTHASASPLQQLQHIQITTQLPVKIQPSFFFSHVNILFCSILPRRTVLFYTICLSLEVSQRRVIPFDTKLRQLPRFGAVDSFPVIALYLTSARAIPHQQCDGRSPRCGLSKVLLSKHRLITRLRNYFE